MQKRYAVLTVSGECVRTFSNLDNAMAYLDALVFEWLSLCDPLAMCEIKHEDMPYNVVDMRAA